MATCRRCNGEGYEFYDDDDCRTLRDACYHCATTGQVDDEVDFHDRLLAVACSLACHKISEYKKARDSGEAGYEEDFAFCAAENMMTESDYFRALIWEEEYLISNKLAAMPRSDQEFLIAWNEMEWEPMPTKKSNVVPFRGSKDIPTDLSEDDIPF